MKFSLMPEVLRIAFSSRPARGAWVEMPEWVIFYGKVPVAPRKGRVG